MFSKLKNIFSTPKPDLILYVILFFFIAFFVWASNAELEEVTRGNGKIIASSKLQVIQNLEGGIINEIAVNTGDKVNEGDLLVKLDETKFLAPILYTLRFSRIIKNDGVTSNVMIVLKPKPQQMLIPNT